MVFQLNTTKTFQSLCYPWSVLRAHPHLLRIPQALAHHAQARDRLSEKLVKLILEAVYC